MALLLPDPCDPHCPEAFKQQARRILLGMHGRPKGWMTVIESDEGLRRVILKFVADFANWDRAADRTYVDVGRALAKAAHSEDSPLVVDPFAGGGSIPLEALRLGCEAFASESQPSGLLDPEGDAGRHPALRGRVWLMNCAKAGAEIQTPSRAGNLRTYTPPTRTVQRQSPISGRVRCDARAPSCGAEIPLSPLLSGCAGSRSASGPLRHRVERPNGAAPRVEFEVYEPETDPRGARRHRDAGEGNVPVLVLRCCRPNGCGHSLPPSGAAQMSSSTRTVAASAGARMTAVGDAPAPARRAGTTGYRPTKTMRPCTRRRRKHRGF